MQTVSKVEFTKATVLLDGHEYVGCTFTSCILEFNGTAPFTLRDNQISSDCRFAFGGAAANTLNAMQAIFRMNDWGRTQVLATFQQIAPGLKAMN